MLCQIEKREVFGNFGEIIALGRKEEIIREFLWKFWKSKREKNYFQKNISCFFIAISKLFSRSGNSELFKRVVIYQLNF